MNKVKKINRNNKKKKKKNSNLNLAKKLKKIISNISYHQKELIKITNKNTSKLKRKKKYKPMVNNKNKFPNNLMIIGILIKTIKNSMINTFLTKSRKNKRRKKITSN